MLRRNPITLCLYATGKGHYGRVDIYKQTVETLLRQIPAEGWGHMIAHIKSADEPHVPDMVQWLKEHGFEVLVTRGSFRHFDQSHQDQYLADQHRVTHHVKTPYLLHVEDDFEIRSYDRDLEYWLHEGISMLESTPELMQIRIARFTDEAKRINGLKAKHGLDVRAEPGDDKAFRHGDYSANPFLARTRDMRAAVTLVQISNLPKHVEHGVGQSFKLLSCSLVPFACFNPDRLRAGHLGAPSKAEQDDLDKPLMAN